MNVRALLAPVDPIPAETLDAWWHQRPATAGAAPIDRAFEGGLLADRLGFAFAAGYAAALQALVPALGESIAALCATEDGGAHPRAIHTRLDGDGTVTGRKKWATVATHASSLLVVATTGLGDDGKPRLRVARVAADAPGVTLRATTAPFVPEIPHAEVELAHAPVAEILPGDGYTQYLRPFRTVEDIHVHAALIGYLLGVVRRHRLPGRERLLVLAIATRELAACDRDDPATHLALAGVIELVRAVVAELESAWTSGSDERARWQRDRALLDVASKARAARLDKARAATS